MHHDTWYFIFILIFVISCMLVGTKNYDPPEKFGKARFFTLKNAPFKIDPGHVLKKVRWHEDSERLLAIQFVAGSTSMDIQELMGKHIESPLYGGQDTTHMKEYTAPISSMGIVGIAMKGKQVTNTLPSMRMGTCCIICFNPNKPLR